MERAHARLEPGALLPGHPLVGLEGLRQLPLRLAGVAEAVQRRRPQRLGGRGAPEVRLEVADGGVQLAQADLGGRQRQRGGERGPGARVAAQDAGEGGGGGLVTLLLRLEGLRVLGGACRQVGLDGPGEHPDGRAQGGAGLLLLPLGEIPRQHHHEEHAEQRHDPDDDGGLSLRDPALGPDPHPLERVRRAELLSTHPILCHVVSWCPSCSGPGKGAHCRGSGWLDVNDGRAAACGRPAWPCPAAPGRTAGGGRAVRTSRGAGWDVPLVGLRDLLRAVAGDGEGRRGRAHLGDVVQPERPAVDDGRRVRVHQWRAAC